jgi:hypothetical protein
MNPTPFPKAATLKFYFEYDKTADVLKYKSPWKPGEYGYHYGIPNPSKYGTTIGNKGSVIIGDSCLSVKRIITTIS